MEEKDSEIVIENIQDAKDLFTIETILNGLMDKFETVEKTTAKQQNEINKLLIAVTDLTAAVKELVEATKDLRDKAEVTDHMEKIRKDNIALSALNKKLKSSAPANVETSETPAEESKPAKKTEEKVPAPVPEAPVITTKTASTKIIEEARKCIASVQGTNKRLYLFKEMSGNYTDKVFARNVYEYLKEIGFITDGGKILDKKIKI